MPHDVFISYATEDKLTADAICASLEARRIRCWIAPRDVRPGADFYVTIDDTIGESRLMVVVFSSSANASRYVSSEVRLAFDREIPILPFRIEAVDPSKQMALSIRYAHWLDALTSPLERHLRHLADSVESVLPAAPQSSAGETAEAPPAAPAERMRPAGLPPWVIRWR